MRGWGWGWTKQRNEHGALTSASASVTAIHERQPVILAADERCAWVTDSAFAASVLGRAGPELVMTAAEASGGGYEQTALF